MFHSTCERAGLAFVVDCPPLPEPVYVDPDMWEKIVLNLVSNAFKFTFAGEIEVRLRTDRAGRAAELTVRDTGTGIPVSELPRIFDRFHRIEGQRGRTHEGTGIGLALVQELAKLHGGSVHAESVEAHGSTFVVSVPFGRDHLPADRIGAARTLASTAARAAVFVDEAIGWLPRDAGGRSAADGAGLEGLPAGAPRSRLVLAEDNADMRDYIRRLLDGRHEVEAVADGAAALEAIRSRPPDLVLTDVMMPRLDGFGLLRAIRDDPELRGVPVLMLSARAGEEASVEGLSAGADDYIAKPFSPRELVARIDATLAMARVRQHASEALREREARLSAIVDQATVGIVQTDLEARFVLANDRYCEILGRSRDELLGGLRMQDVTHPDDLPRNIQLFARTAETGEPFVLEKRYLRPDGETVWVMNSVTALRDAKGRVESVLAVTVDISERRRAEEAARVAEERLTAALIASRTGTFRWDIKTDAVHVDEAINRLFGLAPGEMARHLDEFIPLIHPDDRPGLLERVERCARDGADFDMEFRVVWPDGSHHWIYDRGKTFRDAEGRPAYLAGACVDITDRKRAEEALRDLQAQLQAVFDDAPLGVYLVDSDFRIQQVNPTAFPVFGDIPDLIGRDFDEVIHILWSKEYADEIVRLFRHTLESGEPYVTPERIEERRDRGLTEYYEWQLGRVPLPEGRYGVVCYFRDISARVYARLAVAASQERLRFMAESMPQKIFTATPEGAVDYFNEQWTEFTGLSFEQIRNWGWTQFIHPDDVEENVRVWQRSIDTGETFQFTHRFRRADGAYRWHLSRARAMRDTDGKITMWIGSNTDVHEQKEAAEAYRELSETLERKVAERTRALEAESRERRNAEATLQQAQKMESIGQLTGGVAHDFNNVLAAVLGSLDLARNRVPDPAGRRFLENAQRAAERGARLTDHLLTFARKQALRPEARDLNRLIASFKDLLARTIGPAIEIRLALADDLWPVMADASQFEMALLNLAVNARDAMQDGGALTIATRNVAAGSPDLPHDLAAAGYVQIRVSDTGAGMSADVAGRAFEPFYTTKDIGKGTGLGLSQVYGLSKQLGGTATLASEVGKGTSVSLFLPRTRDTVASAVPERAAAELPATATPHGARVLVIDDEPDVRDFAVEALSSLGFDVTAAETARRGLEILDSGTPVDVAVVDFAMPGMNGIEFIRRARVSHPALPCLLITGYVDLDQVGDLTFDVMMLRKPFRLSDLAESLDNLMARAEGGGAYSGARR